MSVLLAVGMVLFTIGAVVHLGIGLATPFFIRSDESVSILFVSGRTDTALYGQAPGDLVRADPVLGQLRRTILVALAGLLVGLAILELALVWFGLRAQQGWALVALGASGAAMLPYWYLVFQPYLAASGPMSLADLPPFIWVPSVLLVPAFVASWIGLRA